MTFTEVLVTKCTLCFPLSWKVLKNKLYWGWRCGKAAKATICDIAIPCGSQFISGYSISLLVPWDMKHKMGQVLGSLPLMWETGWRSLIQVLASVRAGCWGHVGVKQQMEHLLPSFSVTLTFKIHKLINKSLNKIKCIDGRGLHIW